MKILLTGLSKNRKTTLLMELIEGVNLKRSKTNIKVDKKWASI
jgi:hypothetical protein